MLNVFLHQCAMLVGQEAAKLAVGLVVGQAERAVESWERLVRERQRTAHMQLMEPLLMALADQRAATLHAELDAGNRARMAMVALRARAEHPSEARQLERLHARHEAARAATLLALEQLKRGELLWA